MRRLLVVLVVVLAACSSGGSTTAATTSSSSPASSAKELKGTLTITAPVSNSSIAHTSDNTACGVRLDGSATGFDDLADVTVKDRAGKLLADGRMPKGALRLSASSSSSQVCVFHFTLTMYEQPSDVGLFEFAWKRANVVVSETVAAATVLAGAVAIESTLN